MWISICAVCSNGDLPPALRVNSYEAHHRAQGNLLVFPRPVRDTLDLFCATPRSSCTSHRLSIQFSSQYSPGRSPLKLSAPPLSQRIACGVLRAHHPAASAEVTEFTMKGEKKLHTRFGLAESYGNMDWANVLHIIHHASGDAGCSPSRCAAGPIADRGFPRARWPPAQRR